MSLEAVPRLRENFFYLLVAVEIGVDIYIRHLAHILGRIELGDIRALEKDMLYPRRRKQVFELAARHLLICTLEHEHIMAALEFRDDIRRDIPVLRRAYHNIFVILCSRASSSSFSKSPLKSSARPPSSTVRTRKYNLRKASSLISSAFSR